MAWRQLVEKEEPQQGEENEAMVFGEGVSSPPDSPRIPTVRAVALPGGRGAGRTWGDMCVGRVMCQPGAGVWRGAPLGTYADPRLLCVVARGAKHSSLARGHTSCVRQCTARARSHGVGDRRFREDRGRQAVR